jgi:uncharacterized protein (TIGR00730 family)
VFCSASDQVSPIYASEMTLLGRGLAEHGFTIVYGGSRSGPMAALADSALSVGGRVVGVVTEGLKNLGKSHSSLSELLVAKDLSDRKDQMLARSDVVVASPGGLGTMDEITDLLARKQLGEIHKPFILHNFLGYWNPLLDFLRELEERRMVHHPLDDLVTRLESAQAIVSHILDLQNKGARSP